MGSSTILEEELPEGWEKIKLSDVGKWGSGGTPSRAKSAYYGKGIPWVKSGDLKDGPITQTDEQITEQGLKNSSAKLLPIGTLSLAMYGATIGKLGILTFPAATNQACANVIVEERLTSNKFLFYYLLGARQELIDLGQGGAQPNLSQEIVKEFPFPLPPLLEQNRIVAKLDQILPRIDTCKARIERIPLTIKRFKQGILCSAFEGTLTKEFLIGSKTSMDFLDEILNAWKKVKPKKEINPPDSEIVDTPPHWKWACLEYICDPRRPITYGVIKLGKVVKDGIPCLRTSDVKPLYIDTVEVKKISKSIADNYARTYLSGGEVLINVRGTLGGIAVVPIELKGWNISREVAMAPVVDIIDSRYVAFWIASQYAQNWLTDKEKGVAYTGINIEDLKLLPIPIPPLEEQAEIVRRVESLFLLADRLEAQYLKAKAKVDKLTQSVLAKAFRGELVPQDPSDEPASKLLERIKAPNPPDLDSPKKPKRKLALTRK